MRLFALETSTERLSLALHCDGNDFERDVDAGQSHSDLALPLIRELFAEAGVGVADLDAIAFGQGPGSFTGVRIACGLAQGLSLGSGVGLLPVESQMSIAEQGANDRVVVALDARMDEIYLAAYCRDESSATGWRHEIAPVLVRGDRLPPLAGGPGRQWTLAGSATLQPRLREVLLQAYGALIAGVDDGRHPTAAAAARIARRVLAARGKAALLAARDAAPLYLRDRVAQTIAERRASALAKSVLA